MGASRSNYAAGIKERLCTLETYLPNQLQSTVVIDDKPGRGPAGKVRIPGVNSLLGSKAAVDVCGKVG